MSWPPYSSGARMHTSDAPPTRKSISALGDVNPVGCWAPPTPHVLGLTPSLPGFPDRSTEDAGDDDIERLGTIVVIVVVHGCQPFPISHPRPHELSSLHDAKPQVRCRRGFDRPRGLELDVLAAEVLEHPGAAVEQHGHEVDGDLVDQPGPDVLLPDIRPAHHSDVLVAGGCLCLL